MKKGFARYVKQATFESNKRSIRSDDLYSKCALSCMTNSEILEVILSRTRSIVIRVDIL